MTVGELITRLIEFGNMDATVYVVTPGDLDSIEDDMGTMVMLYGVDNDGIHSDTSTGDRP